MDPPFWDNFVGSRYSEVFDLSDSGVTNRLLAVEVSTGRNIFVYFAAGASVSLGDRVTLMDFRVLKEASGYTLVQEDASAIFPHGPFVLGDLLKVREFCTGLGALGLGAEQAGFRVVAQNEIQEPTALLASAISGLSVVTGDVGDNDVLKQVWKQAPGCAATAAGVSCQPYSLLGDRRGGRDPRSDALPSTLRAAWLMQSPLIVLECVAPAAEDAFVKQCLADFAAMSGFSLKECLLELRDVWPAARKRWWCVLASPRLGDLALRGWRPHGAWRTVADVLECPNVSPSESRQLRLDPEEVHALASFRPLASFVLEANRPSPTALHSWGCLFRPCPCQCRPLPLSTERLKKAGVCAVILPDEGTAGEGEVVPFRYPSASEIALLNGLDPSINFLHDARLALCLVGQLASPLQAGWVFSQIASLLQAKGLHVSCSTDPVHVLHKQRLRLLKKAELVGLRPSHLFRMHNGPPDILYQTHAKVLARAGARAKYAEVAQQVEAFRHLPGDLLANNGPEVRTGHLRLPSEALPQVAPEELDLPDPTQPDLESQATHEAEAAHAPLGEISPVTVKSSDEGSSEAGKPPQAAAYPCPPLGSGSCGLVLAPPPRPVLAPSGLLLQVSAQDRPHPVDIASPDVSPDAELARGGLPVRAPFMQSCQLPYAPSWPATTSLSRPLTLALENCQKFGTTILFVGCFVPLLV